MHVHAAIAKSIPNINEIGEVERCGEQIGAGRSIDTSEIKAVGICGEGAYDYMRVVQQQRTAAERCSQPRIHKHGFVCMLLQKVSTTHKRNLRYREVWGAEWSGVEYRDKRDISNGKMRRVCIRKHAGNAAAASRGGAM